MAGTGLTSFRKASAVEEVHILWMTAGLSCDGDSVSMTAATQPSIEDVLLGAIPGLCRVGSPARRGSDGCYDGGP